MVKAATAFVCEGWSKRTFKREIAALAILFWSVLTIRIFWFADTELIGALGTAYGTASTSIWLYTMGAFGMDAYTKSRNQPAATPNYGD